MYANHGRKSDYEQLLELGVNVTGKIVLARYGSGNRGSKVAFMDGKMLNGNKEFENFI